jgi:hypothetical protein
MEEKSENYFLERLVAEYRPRLDLLLIQTIFNEHADHNYDEAKSILDMIVSDLPPD